MRLFGWSSHLQQFEKCVIAD